MKKYRLSIAMLAMGLAACSSSTTATTPTPAATEEPVATETTAPETIEIEHREIDVDALVADGMNVSYADSYGIYSQEGDAIDSAIGITVYVNTDTNEVVNIDIVEALIPVAMGGAEGWATLDEESATAFDGATTEIDGTYYITSFSIDGIVWNFDADTATYSAEIDGESVEFMAYISEYDGGKWYSDNRVNGAEVLDADGNVVGTIAIETKESINHGVGFWPSDIKFPGNMDLIKNYVYDNGVNYDYYPSSSDITNSDGQWVVADTVTGATLAGAPNYFNMIKEAYDKVVAGEGTAYTAE